MKGAANCLREFGIEYEAHVLSAHRSSGIVGEETFGTFGKTDCKVIIAGAGRRLICRNCFQDKFCLLSELRFEQLWREWMPCIPLCECRSPFLLPVWGLTIPIMQECYVQMLAIENTDLAEKLREFRNKMKEQFAEENKKVEL